MHQDPRRLVCVLDLACVHVVAASLHAPCRLDHFAVAWWKETEAILRRTAGGHQLIVATDANLSGPTCLHMVSRFANQLQTCVS